MLKGFRTKGVLWRGSHSVGSMWAHSLAHIIVVLQSNDGFREEQDVVNHLVSGPAAGGNINNDTFGFFWELILECSLEGLEFCRGLLVWVC